MQKSAFLWYFHLALILLPWLSYIIQLPFHCLVHWRTVLMVSNPLASQSTDWFVSVLFLQWEHCPEAIPQKREEVTLVAPVIAITSLTDVELGRSLINRWKKIWLCLSCMNVYAPHACRIPQRSEEGIGAPGPGPLARAVSTLIYQASSSPSQLQPLDRF